MVSEGNKIIYNRLVSNGALYIPDVGTLTLLRQPAMYTSRKRIVSPRYFVDFSADKIADSLVDIIADVASVDVATAEDICLRWLDKVRTEDGFTIEGVGILKSGHFTLDEALESQLCPFGVDYINVTTRRRGWAFAAVACVVLALCGVSAWWFMRDTATVEPQILVAEEIVVDESQIVETVVVETIVEETEEQGSAAEQIAEIVETPEPEVVTPADWRDNENIRHGVVIGSYSTTENAERAIKEFETKSPELMFSHIRLGSMYAVASYGSAEKTDCEEFVQNHKCDFAQLWIYTPKRYRE